MADQQYAHRTVEANGERFRIPMVWFGVTNYAAAFPVPRDPIEALMPSGDLRPALTLNGDALLWVEVSRFPIVAVTREDGQRNVMPPMAICMIGALVTYRAAPSRFSALSLGRSNSRTGLLEFNSPVSLRAARDAGRQIWREPKFVADIAIRLGDDGDVTSEASEGGNRILRLNVPRAGRLSPYSSDVHLYAATDGRLSRYRYHSRGWRNVSLRPGHATLDLGAHPVGAELQRLGVRSKSYLAMTTVDELNTQFPAEGIGDTDRGMATYRGSDASHGSLTFEAPGLAPVDLYAGMTDELMDQGVYVG